MEKDLFRPPIPLEGYSSYQDMIDAATKPDLKNRENFWEDVAKQLIDWNSTNFINVIGKIGDKDSIWYDGGELNVCYNCVDRHAKVDPNRVALIYEGNEENQGCSVTYGELLTRVSKMANVLKSYGVTKGSVVVIFLPVCCEAIISMLACARIGAVHSLIFGAFRGDALQFRIIDCQPKVIITANGYDRATKVITMKKTLDEIIDNCKSVEHVIVCELINLPVQMKEGRDVSLSKLLESASSTCECVPMQSRDPLFYLYTSGSTGNPKGIIHRCGGYSVAAALTHRFVFSIYPGDVFGCTSDLGWITGHTYVCYGPLLNGVTTLVFGGLPLYPDATRSWKLISSLKLTHFYTSPSAARAISASISKNIEKIDEFDLSSLRVIGSVGETLDDTTWKFLFETLGKRRCSIVDTYWQTEMGSIIATSIPGHHQMKPGYIGQPLFGTELVLLDPKDHHLIGSTSKHSQPKSDALLCIASPWPGLANDCLAGHDKFVKKYIIPGTNYFSTGDVAAIDADGYLKITGRTDDQLCVNGHRVGPAEVEAAIMEHPKAKEAAVIGVPHPLTGQSIVAFVVTDDKSEKMKSEVKDAVFAKFGAIGRPSVVYLVDDLPKTRSEKIIRMLLRGIVAKLDVEEPPTIKNPEVIPYLKKVVND
ncbi:acetate--CoA ligase [Histomonas meleagridis]|uniref:acetate--CoA ligase n=1 Tax=Histomonas meleagridis TaxID=135588 RepID=UPI00355A7B46|nr:acetate--CoA ligase [Histomonas meleagridis]KAH0798058.1 acetate--CoA ligase [Histomonas meleagridis]